MFNCYQSAEIENAGAALVITVTKLYLFCFFYADWRDTTYLPLSLPNMA